MTARRSRSCGCLPADVFRIAQSRRRAKIARRGPGRRQDEVLEFFRQVAQGMREPAFWTDPASLTPERHFGAPEFVNACAKSLHEPRFSTSLVKASP